MVRARPVSKSITAPAGLGHQLRARERVAAVVAGRSFTYWIRLSGLPVSASTLLHDLDVRQRPVAADVVDLAVAALLQHRQNAAAVVFDVQPVAHLHAVAVDRQRSSSALAIISGINFSGNWYGP